MMQKKGKIVCNKILANEKMVLISMNLDLNLANSLYIPNRLLTLIGVSLNINEFHLRDVILRHCHL